MCRCGFWLVCSVKHLLAADLNSRAGLWSRTRKCGVRFSYLPSLLSSVSSFCQSELYLFISSFCLKVGAHFILEKIWSRSLKFEVCCHCRTRELNLFYQRQKKTHLYLFIWTELSFRRDITQSGAQRQDKTRRQETRRRREETRHKERRGDKTRKEERRQYERRQDIRRWKEKRGEETRHKETRQNEGGR